MDEALHIPLWFDLLAVFVGGVSGSLVAAKNRYDMAGVLVVAMVSGLGGGMIRDVMLGAGPPAALRNPDYLYVAFGAALVGLPIRSIFERIGPLVVIVEAASLAAFTVVGMEKGLLFDLPLISAAMLGVITAVGGGLLRDILGGEAPSVLRPGALSLTAALGGVIVYAILHLLGADRQVAGWSAIVVTFSLRMGSRIFGWTTPEAAELPGHVGHLGANVLTASERLAHPAQRVREKGSRRVFRRRTGTLRGE